MAKKKAKSNNVVANIVVGVLALAIGAVSVCCVGYVSRNDEGKWFSNSDLASWHWADNKSNVDDNNGGNTDNGNKDENKDEDKGNVIITGGVSDSGVNVYSAVLPRSAYAANGISETAETAIKLTATIKPETANNQEVDWSFNWENASSTFANGKPVTDFVNVNPTSDGSLTANLECYQAFGERIFVTCTSRDNPNAKATCMLDYSQKIENVVLKFGDITANLGGTTQIKYEVNPNGVAPGGETEVTITKSSVYTIEDNFTYSVKVNYTGLSDSHFALNGSTITGMPSGDKDITSDGLYFDYAHDVSNWLIMGRTSDILFKNLSTAEIIEYFSDITVDTLFNVSVEVSGNYSNYTAQTLFTCIGYTNHATVDSVEFDRPSVIF